MGGQTRPAPIQGRPNQRSISSPSDGEDAAPFRAARRTDESTLPGPNERTGAINGSGESRSTAVGILTSTCSPCCSAGSVSARIHRDGCWSTIAAPINPASSDSNAAAASTGLLPLSLGSVGRVRQGCQLAICRSSGMTTTVRIPLRTVHHFVPERLGRSCRGFNSAARSSSRAVCERRHILRAEGFTLCDREGSLNPFQLQRPGNGY